MEIRNSTFDHIVAQRTPPNSPRRIHRREKDRSILHVLSEEQVDIYNEDLALSKVMHPIYISMACFGLVWRSHGKLLVAKRLDLCTVHCVFMLVLIWLNGLHFFLAYDKNDEYGKTLFKKITGHIFALQLASGISTYVYFNHKHIPFFLKQWENYKLCHGGLSLSSMTRHVFNRVVVVNIILLCFYSLYSVFLLLSNKELHLEILVPISKYISTPSPTWLRVLYTTVHLYIVMAWLQSIIFTGSMCYLLKREFKQLSTQFFKAVHTDQQSVQFARNKSLRQVKALDGVPDGVARRQNTYEAEQYRKRHLELCKLVARLDKIMSSYLLFLYLYSVPIVVFLLYTLWDYGTDYDKDVTSVLVNVISLIFFVALLVSVTRAGASLAVAAKEPKDVLHEIDLQKCSLEEGNSVQIFLHKVSADHAGLTTGNIINIDKSLLITFCTMIITYLALLLKFAITLGASCATRQESPDEHCTCINNNTLTQLCASLIPE